MATTSANPANPVETCPECGNSVHQQREIETVCESCGLVVDSDPIDRGPEWRAFSNEEGDRSRVSKPDRDRHDRGLGSDMATGPASAGRTRRLEKLHRHAKNGSKKDRNRGDATSQIQRMGMALEVDKSTIKQAKSLFRQIHEQEVHCLDTMAAVALYTTCRANKLGRTPADVADVAHSDETSIARHHRRVSNEFGIPTPPPSPSQRVRVVAGSLSVSDTVRERAVGILESLDDHECQRGSPSTLAAAALYLASKAVGEGRSQDEISDASGCSSLSLRNRMRDIQRIEATT